MYWKHWLIKYKCKNSFWVFNLSLPVIYDRLTINVELWRYNEAQWRVIHFIFVIFDMDHWIWTQIEYPKWVLAFITNGDYGKFRTRNFNPYDYESILHYSWTVSFKQVKCCLIEYDKSIKLWVNGLVMVFNATFQNCVTIFHVM
jgi:hypothetical protein